MALRVIWCGAAACRKAGVDRKPRGVVQTGAIDPDQTSA
jgi:hypothetical protein